MIGPGKYDDVCTMVRERVGLGDTGMLPKGGGVVVIVIGGNKGHGFSCQTDLDMMLALPDILEGVARQMRAGKMP